jgi:hypothetical protein
MAVEVQWLEILEIHRAVFLEVPLDRVVHLVVVGELDLLALVVLEETLEPSVVLHLLHLTALEAEAEAAALDLQKLAELALADTLQ